MLTMVQLYARKLDTLLLMGSVCEELGDSILDAMDDLRQDRYPPIPDLKFLSRSTRGERQAIQNMRPVPAGFILEPVTDEGIPCIRNNADSLPMNAAFLEALTRRGISSEVWIVCKEIKAGRNFYARRVYLQNTSRSLKHTPSAIG
jgi:hypothetical protein